MVRLMATIVGNNVSLVSALLPINRLGFKPAPKPKSPILASRASSVAILQAQPDHVSGETKSTILACPICYERVTWNGNRDLSMDSISGSSLQCKSCNKLYCGDYKDSHIDLTIDNVSGEPLPASIELFRFPWMSFLYERGWRQCFALVGFPGPEKEFEMIKDYLKPVLGGNIIDASCGSGMFSRLFAKSGLFSLVVALDFSETMLRQCYDFIKQDESFPQENFIMVRADISRLPFGSSSVAAVHAGAALHCWPSPSAAVAEISRVLRPGGLFVATTCVFDDAPQYIEPLRQNIARISGMNFYLSEKELEDLCASCGLVDFKCTRNRNFVMISAKKPV
ncbi:hypothetical protein CASFOL_034620 [Castilleja foliolosa]|uniref:Methyltransferase type 11 domain-containing protein n=1 Tax=Castilleja foliolosa TaxID=1961234 RepID=A0ABD3BQD7_9LAMI